MSTSLSDLIQAGMETADVEKSSNYSLPEKTRIANESLSEVYDLVVVAWESYFQATATFDLDVTAVKSLASITTGVPDVPPYPVASPALGDRVTVVPPGPVFSSTVAANTSKQFFAVGGTTSFAAPPGTYVPPAGRILQLDIDLTGTTTNDCLFTIYKNGKPTLAFNFVGSGSSGSVNVPEGAFGKPVYFNGEDVMDLCAEQSGTPHVITFGCETLFQLDQPPSLFYKEAGLMKQGCSDPILPLSTYSERNNVFNRSRYWISGGNISFWPQIPGGATHEGTYILDYVPNCPVLVASDVIPFEIERWKELITVVMAIKFKTKRDQDTSSLERRQLKLEQGITLAKGKRKKEVHRLQPMRNWDQFPAYWRNRGRGFFGP